MARTEIKRLANNMDYSCESANSHDFVITHRALAVLMTKSLGLQPTLRVMRKIRKEGGRHGLSGLTGVAGTGPDVEYLERLGISTNWADWNLP